MVDPDGLLYPAQSVIVVAPPPVDLGYAAGVPGLGPPVAKTAVYPERLEIYLQGTGVVAAHLARVVEFPVCPGLAGDVVQLLGEQP